MITIKTFIFNPFQVNTYILSDESGEAAIIDAACSNDSEFGQLCDYISLNKLVPVKLINTHGHIDHLLGIAPVSEKFGLIPEFHEKESYLLKTANEQAMMFGLKLNPLPKISYTLKEGTEVKFGLSGLDIFHVPGHSEGSVAFYSKPVKFVITGDVLFNGSIGRTDLPGGNYNQLIESIFKNLLVLDDEVKVLPGHGPSSSIGAERANNPFL